MINYVVGFIFDELFDNVLLVHKNRPEWQKGKLNGVGGKIEVGETPYEAMIRECEEECGLLLYNWLLVEEFTDDRTYKVYFFTIQTPSLAKALTKTDEEIEVFSVKNLFTDNLGMDIIIYPANVLILNHYLANHVEENLND